MSRGLGLVWHTAVARFRLPLGPMVSVRARHPSRRRRYLSCDWASVVQTIHSQENSRSSKWPKTKVLPSRNSERKHTTQTHQAAHVQSSSTPIHSVEIANRVRQSKNMPRWFSGAVKCGLWIKSVNEKDPNQTSEHCGVVSVSI